MDMMVSANVELELLLQQAALADHAIHLEVVGGACLRREG